MDKIFDIIVSHDHVELAAYANTNKKVLNVLSEELDIPLCLAARTGCIDCCATLIGAGTKTGHEFFIKAGCFSPLFAAAGGDHLDCFKWLEKNGFPILPEATSEEWTVFNLAIDKGAEKVFEYMLPKINVNFSAPNGYPPLTRALLSNQLQFVKPLVEAGANVDGTDYNGNILIGDHRFHVPITCAIVKEDKSIIEYLISKGADINQKGLEMTALDIAKYLNKDDLAKYIVSLGGK